MDACCNKRNVLDIEIRFLSVDANTCERCEGSLDAVRETVASLSETLTPLGITVNLIETQLSREQLSESNTVLLNGRPLEEWIGGSKVETECSSCSDLLDDDVCCAATVVNGATSESVDRDHLMSAAMTALGLGGTPRIIG